MAAREVQRNHETRYCKFYIDDLVDIAKLPTSKKSGSGELSLSRPCVAGSIATDVTGRKYILNGNDDWVIYNCNSSSSVSGQRDVIIRVAENVTDSEPELVPGTFIFDTKALALYLDLDDARYPARDPLKLSIASVVKSVESGVLPSLTTNVVDEILSLRFDSGTPISIEKTDVVESID